MISKATERNWRKLKIEDESQKLVSRANKTRSVKTILPHEYFKKANRETIKKILSYIKENNIDLDIVINTLCLKFLFENEMIFLDNHKFASNKENVQTFIDKIQPYDKNLFAFTLPKDEDDVLGLIYQSLLKEGDKNKSGTYYTPSELINSLIENIEIKDNQKVLDPCCGSGSFLLKFNCKPENLYGVDFDRRAVIIAKVNLIVKYKNYDFTPNIFEGDFLADQLNLPTFDYIITNPPWGTKYEKDYKNIFKEAKNELFSLFLYKSTSFLKEKGSLRFILPISIKDVEIHKGIRKFIFKSYAIEKIKHFGKCFDGVLTDVIGLFLIKGGENEQTIVQNDDETYLTKLIPDKKNSYSFITIKSDVKQVLDKIFSSPHQSLIKCDFALGIVTGNNKEKLKLEKRAGLLPIYTGKEIIPYKLKKNKYFLAYQRDNLQQVAKDEAYFADEKLLYKFISKSLVFAYDNKGSLCLNSANVIVPKDMGMSAKSLCLILNSKTMNFVYQNKFRQIKVLKSNLCQLPIPFIDKVIDRKFIEIFDSENEDMTKEVDEFLFKYFKLSNKEKEIIKSYRS